MIHTEAQRLATLLDPQATAMVSLGRCSIVTSAGIGSGDSWEDAFSSLPEPYASEAAYLANGCSLVVAAPVP